MSCEDRGEDALSRRICRISCKIPTTLSTHGHSHSTQSFVSVFLCEHTGLMRVDGGVNPMKASLVCVCGGCDRRFPSTYSDQIAIHPPTSSSACPLSTHPSFHPAVSLHLSLHPSTILPSFDPSIPPFIHPPSLFLSFHPFSLPIVSFLTFFHPHSPLSLPSIHAPILSVLHSFHFHPFPSSPMHPPISPAFYPPICPTNIYLNAPLPCSICGHAFARLLLLHLCWGSVGSLCPRSWPQCLKVPLLWFGDDSGVSC